MKGKRHFVGAMAGFMLLATAAFSADKIFAGEDEEKILSGIYVGDVYIGGNTKEEAMEIAGTVKFVEE